MQPFTSTLEKSRFKNFAKAIGGFLWRTPAMDFLKIAGCVFTYIGLYCQFFPVTIEKLFGTLLLFLNLQTQPPEVFYEKRCLQTSQENPCARASFLIKLQAFKTCFIAFVLTIMKNILYENWISIT